MARAPPNMTRSITPSWLVSAASRTGRPWPWIAVHRELDRVRRLDPLAVPDQREPGAAGPDSHHGALLSTADGAGDHVRGASIVLTRSAVNRGPARRA